jgi:hypothetical protein
LEQFAPAAKIGLFEDGGPEVVGIRDECALALGCDLIHVGVHEVVLDNLVWKLCGTERRLGYTFLWLALF